MPALRRLVLWEATEPDQFEALFRHTVWPSLEALDLCILFNDGETGAGEITATAALAALASAWRNTPRLRALELGGESDVVLEAAPRALAAAGWRLQKLDICYVGAAGMAALAAAPSFALRELKLDRCLIGAAGVFAIAAASWPLEKLEFEGRPYGEPSFGPALAALSRHTSLRHLTFNSVLLGGWNIKDLIDATWPELTRLIIDQGEGGYVQVEEYEYRELDDASFAGFPKLEVLALGSWNLTPEGAAIMASRRWRRLRELRLTYNALDNLGPWPVDVGALALGSWPALERLHLSRIKYGSPTLEAVQRWAPTVTELTVEQPWV